MYYDMHTHSTFSSDSVMTPEEAVHSAIVRGLAGIAFTDHLDIDYIGYEDAFMYDFSDYFRMIDRIRDSAGCRLQVLSGVEIGIQPHVIEATTAKLDGFSFDFRIGSVHIVNRKDPYLGAPYFQGRSKLEAYREYLEVLLNMLHLYHDFDALGHIDFIVRYAAYADNRMYYADFHELLDEILRFIIHRQIALEINTGTYFRCLPDRALLLRYRELGGELITLGSDAHDSKDLGRLFQKTAAFIKDCGFSEIAHYIGRKPHFTKIV